MGRILAEKMVEAQRKERSVKVCNFHWTPTGSSPMCLNIERLIFTISNQGSSDLIVRK